MVDKYNLATLCTEYASFNKIKTIQQFLEAMCNFITTIDGLDRIVRPNCPVKEPLTINPTIKKDLDTKLVTLSKDSIITLAPKERRTRERDEWTNSEWTNVVPSNERLATTNERTAP